MGYKVDGWRGHDRLCLKFHDRVYVHIHSCKNNRKRVCEILDQGDYSENHIVIALKSNTTDLYVCEREEGQRLREVCYILCIGLSVNARSHKIAVLFLQMT